MNGCPKPEALAAFFEGELPEPEAARIRTHVGSCDECAGEIAAWEGLDALLAPAGDESVPAGLAGSLRAIPDRPRAAIRRAPSLVAASLAAALLLAAVWLGPETAPPTVPPLEAPAPVLRTRVLSALLGREPDSERLLDDLGESVLVLLAKIARGEDEEAARAALERLGEYARPESLPAILAAAGMPGRRVEAVRALGRIGDPRALSALGPLLLDGGPDREVLAAVERIGGAGAARLIRIRVERDPAGPEAMALVASLARVDALEATRALLALAGQPRFAEEAARSLETGRALHVPHLVRVASDRDDAEARMALDVLARLRDPRAVAPLAKLLDRRSRRAGAARVLAATDLPEAAEALVAKARFPEVRAAFDLAGPRTEAWLVEKLETGDASARALAIDLLGRCGGREAVIALHGLAGRRAISPEVIEALGRIGGEWGVAALDLIAENPRLRLKAITALGRTAHPSAVPALVRHGRDGRAAREAALSSLVRIGTAEAVEGVLTLDSTRRAIRALEGMERETVIAALTSMLEGGRGPAARQILAVLDPPQASQGELSSRLF